MARRCPGEGCVKQRANGLWQASLQVEGVRRTGYGKTEKEAKAKLRDLQRETHQNGGLSNPGTRTLGDLLELWRKAADLKPRTRHDYESLARRYITSTLEQVRLSRLTPERLQALYTGLQGRGLERAPAQLHSMLHRALKVAVLWRWLPANPADRVLKPAYRPERKDVWTGEELSAFLKVTAGDRHGPLWAFLATTGCRIGEALALRWDGLDLEAGTVTIRANLQRIGGRWVEGTPKTKAGERTLSLPEVAVSALRKQRVLLAERRLKAGPDWRDLGLVFPGLNGSPVCTSTVHRALAGACRRAGLAPIGPHQLRHTAASLLLSRGIALPAVSARLGHANPNITATIYSHALRGGDRQAAEALEAVLG